LIEARCHLSHLATRKVQSFFVAEQESRAVVPRAVYRASRLISKLGGARFSCQPETRAGPAAGARLAALRASMPQITDRERD
jgi:hypothetical protein